MSSHSGQLERGRLQTVNLPPDKVVHILTPEQAGNSSSLQVLYKRQAGSAGRLGTGSFGAVHLEYRDSDCEAAPYVRAVKTINKDVAKESEVSWQHEIENLIDLSKFPDLFVKIFGWWEDEKSIFLPMEYFEAGDLSRCADLIREENEIRTISYQIALGLQKMHGIHIIHRDLKPQNIFIAAPGPKWKVKIGDFGFSKRISQSVSAPFSTRGTTKYMAPEYRDPWSNSDSSDFTAAVDMWSFGCLIYELFARQCPFDDGGAVSLKRYVKNKKLPQEELDKYCASVESIWTIKQLLEPDPQLRMTADDLVKCAWFEAENISALRESESPYDANPLAVKDEGRQETSTKSLESQTQAPIGSWTGPGATIPTLVVSAVAKEDGHLSPTEQRPELFDRKMTTATVTVDELALIRQESIKKSDLPPRLPPRLPVRPKSSSALREQAQEAQTSSYKERNMSAQAVDVIKPSSITIPRKPVPTRVDSKRSMKLIPTLRCLKRRDGQINMYFTDLPFAPKAIPMCDTCRVKRVFNPSIKPAAMYFCKDCEHRPLCARCVFEMIRSSTDPHEADHKLRPWIQGHRFPFPSFLRHYRMLMTTESGGLETGFGRAWMDSKKHTFVPVEGQMDTSFTLHVPPGEYTVTIDLRTLKNGEALRSSTIGHFRTMMVKRTKTIRLGSILIGAHAIEKLTIPSRKEMAQQPTLFLPDGSKELAVALEEDEHPHSIELERPVKVLSGQLLEVNIRGAYDTSFFKAGSPFQWWLDEISVEHFGSEDYVSSIGDRKMRALYKEQHERLRHEKKVQKNVSVLCQGIDVAGKIGGAFIPGAKLVSTIASGGIKMGASAMKNTSHSNSGTSGFGIGAAAGAGAGLGLTAGAVGPQIVHNNYNMSETHHHVHSNDSFTEYQGEEEPEQNFGEEYEVEEPEDEEDSDQYYEEEYEEQVDHEG